MFPVTFVCGGFSKHHWQYVDYSIIFDISKAEIVTKDEVSVVVIAGGEEGEVANSSPTLAESAAAMQAKLNKAPLKEVDVKTGEEEESNVFQVIMHCEYY